MRIHYAVRLVEGFDGFSAKNSDRKVEVYRATAKGPTVPTEL